MCILKGHVISLEALEQHVVENTDCLSPFGLLQQNATGQMAYEQRKLIFHISGGQKSKIEVPAWSNSGDDPLLSRCLTTSGCVLTRWRGEGVPLGPLLQKR